MPLEEFGEFSVGQLAALSGKAASAIRYYENLGLIESVRTSGNQRRYPRSALRILKYLNFAQSAGFTLKEIVDLNAAIKPGQPLFGHWREMAEAKLQDLDSIILQAEAMKERLLHALNCKCASADKCPLLESLGS